MGGRRRENGSLPGAGKLNSRHGLIQSAVARRVVLRNTPRLTFRLDDSAQRGVDLVNLLEDIDKNLPKAPLPMRKMTRSNILPLAKHGVPGRTALDAPGQRRAGTRRITLPEKSVTGGKAAGPEGPCSRKESSSGNGKRNR